MNNTYAYTVENVTLYISFTVEHGVQKLVIETDGTGKNPRYIGELLYNAYVSMEMKEAYEYAGLMAEMTNVKYTVLKFIERAAAHNRTHTAALMNTISGFEGYRKTIPYNPTTTRNEMVQLWKELSWNSYNVELV